MRAALLRAIEAPRDRFEIRLSGSGGQGIMLAAMILAEAAGAEPGRNVTQTKSYGPEARGGACKADIVLSGGEIYYPKAVKLDLLLAMTQESLDKYIGDLKEDGILVIDNSMAVAPSVGRCFGVPFTRLAKEEAGKVMVANMIALGSIAAITGVVTHDALAKVLLGRSPKGAEEVNRQALDIGLREGAALMETAVREA
jgi:2-oxoglutarate ferredoxin oxidoreductase subunit gamma